MNDTNKLSYYFMQRKARLNSSRFLFPLPFLIAALLVLFLMGITVLNINPRLGHKTDPLRYSGTPADISAIWMNVRLTEDKVTISTNDKKVFEWTRGQIEELSPFNKYLAQRSRDMLNNAILKGLMPADHAVVVLSLDQKLTYQDLKPILASLAHARFHRYAFETRLTAQ